MPQYMLPAMDTTPQSGPASPFAFLGGFVGGLVAGAASVYSLLKMTGQKVSAEAEKVELAALASVAVKSPPVAPTGAHTALALAPYRVDGGGRTALPALGRQLRAMNTGPGRMRVVVNMSALNKSGGFLENKDKLQVYRLCKQAQQALRGGVSAATAAAITLHSEAAHAKSVLGVNGALDFGPLAGDQPGGEGTGKALGINDDSLGFVLLAVPIILGVLFNQWQGYQDDDDDFFDTYDSRRTDKELTNRNRV